MKCGGLRGNCGLSQVGIGPSKIALSTVQRTLRKKSAGKSVEYDSTSRKKTKLKPRVAASLRRIKCAPTKSLRQVATEAGQNRELVRRLEQISGMQSLRRTKIPLVSEAGRKKRQNWARGLLNRFKESGHTGRIIFSDENNLLSTRRSTHRTIVTSEEDKEDAPGDVPAAALKYIARNKHPVSAMFFGGRCIHWRGIPPIWFPTGFRLDSEAYIKALRDTLIPWMRRVVASRGNVPFVWQQDSSPRTAPKNALFFEGTKHSFLDPRRMASKQSRFEPLGLRHMVDGAAGGL